MEKPFRVKIIELETLKNVFKSVGDNDLREILTGEAVIKLPDSTYWGVIYPKGILCTLLYENLLLSLKEADKKLLDVSRFSIFELCEMYLKRTCKGGSSCVLFINLESLDPHKVYSTESNKFIDLLDEIWFENGITC